METAAAVEIDQGGLRRYFLEDFHRCLEKPRTTLGFSTVTTGSAAINQKPTTNKTGQITCYQNRTFLLATDRAALWKRRNESWAPACLPAKVKPTTGNVDWFCPPSIVSALPLMDP